MYNVSPKDDLILPTGLRGGGGGPEWQFQQSMNEQPSDDEGDDASGDIINLYMD